MLDLRVRVEIMGLIIIRNQMRFTYVSEFLRSHYLHPHPHSGLPLWMI
jgi:hypothetical protein